MTTERTTPRFRLQRGEWGYQPILDGVPLMTVRSVKIEITGPGEVAKVTLHIDAILDDFEMPANVEVIETRYVQLTGEIA